MKLNPRDSEVGNCDGFGLKSDKNLALKQVIESCFQNPDRETLPEFWKKS